MKGRGHYIRSNWSDWSIIFICFVNLGYFLPWALCTWTTSYQLASLAHPDSLQSPWSNSNRLLTLRQETTQTKNISPTFKRTLAWCLLFSFCPITFTPSINNSTGNKMEENDWACFLFMAGQQSVQLKVEAGFSFNFPSVLGLINIYVGARACAQQKEGAKGSAFAVISEGQPRRHLIWASDSVNGERNRARKTLVHACTCLRSAVFQRAQRTASNALSHTHQRYSAGK